MFTEYTTQEVLQPVTLEVIKCFTYSVSLPAVMVRDIVLRNVRKENGTVEWGNKITAIQELRELCAIRDASQTPTLTVTLGLREAKEMIEESYRELRERGGLTYSSPLMVHLMDTLPDNEIQI